MSTRSCIAKPHGDGWTGRYHHSDGYPSGLGSTLWKAYHETFAGDVKALRELLIDSEAASAGWSSINGADLTQPPQWGGRNFGDEPSEGPLSYFARGEAPSDPHVCTCPSSETECDPLSIEWAYVLTDQALVVFKSVPGKGPEGYEHRMVGAYPWNGKEPDWNKVEEG